MDSHRANVSVCCELESVGVRSELIAYPTQNGGGCSTGYDGGDGEMTTIKMIIGAGLAALVMNAALPELAALPDCKVKIECTQKGTD